MRILDAAARYYLLGLLCGFGLGAVRSLLLEPALGQFPATLCELPVILTLLWFGCGWAVRTARLGAGLAPRAAMGALWFGAFLVTEFLLGVWMRGWTPSATLAHFRTPQGALGLAGFMIAALFPLRAAQHFRAG